MPRMIFVNLPVADVARSTRLYEAIGFTLNPVFSSPQGSGMVWSDTINVMLLGRDTYSTFTPKPIADTHEESAVLLCLTCDDRGEVDAIAAAALGAGARELHGAEDDGFMYSRAFEDFDGHGWQVMWLDVAAMPQGQDDGDD